MARTRTRSTATLRAGALVTEAELAELARAALDKAGLSLTEAAARVSPPVAVSSVSDAVNQPQRALTDLRLKLLGLADYGAEGPLYRITKAS